MIEFGIRKVKFNDETEIEFKKNDIVIFVGPNNTGKSAILKEIIDYIRDGRKTNLIISELTLFREGDVEEMTENIKQNSSSTIRNGYTYYNGYNYFLKEDNIRNYWRRGHIQVLTDYVMIHLNTEDRLKLTIPPQSINLSSNGLTHPNHRIQQDDTLEKKISDIFYQAYGQHLIVHRNAGNIVPVHIGKKPTFAEGEDRVSRSYLDKLEKLPLLHEQGDGVRSFAAILLSIYASNYYIYVIDEPEAFLYPHQAREIGRILTEREQQHNKQVFIATHSEEVIKGVIDSNIENLKIIRVRRKDNINFISTIDTNEIKEIWKNPILRFSNILSGLFHEEVVICEGDTDCKFYSAIMNSIIENEDLRHQDIQFVHCSGKHRINTIVSSLRRLSVIIKIIVDFDILFNEEPLKKIVRDLGHKWENYKDKFEKVNRAINKVICKKDQLVVAKTRLMNMYKEIIKRDLEEKDLKEIGKVIQGAYGNTLFKRGGKSQIPPGDETRYCSELIESLKQIGIYIVEIGELESFVHEVGKHGPKWMIEVMEKYDLYNSSELDIARKFIRNSLINS